MRQKTKDYILKMFDLRIKETEAMIAERQKWLDYHRKYPESNYDQTLEEYKVWATGIIERKKAYIAEIEEMAKEIREE